MQSGREWWKRKERTQSALLRATCASKSRRRRRFAELANPRILLAPPFSSHRRIQDGSPEKPSSSLEAIGSSLLYECTQSRNACARFLASQHSRSVGFTLGFAWPSGRARLLSRGLEPGLQRSVGLVQRAPA